MAEVLWYYARNDQQFGPVTASELKQLVNAGRLSPDDLLWREGMDAWTTAINLRGLFADDQSAGAAKTVAGVAEAAVAESASVRPQTQGAAQYSTASASLRSTLRATQVILWVMCVLVVLAGVVLFTRDFLIAKDPAEEAAAGAVFSTFFIGAYVLARCGEKLSKLLLAISRRRSR
jgi:GYF domain 2